MTMNAGLQDRKDPTTHDVSNEVKEECIKSTERFFSKQGPENMSIYLNFAYHLLL